jgi:hypothetical protein
MTVIYRLVAGSVALLSVLTASAVAAQEPVAPEPSARAGWTFVPSFGLAQTYDDNITLWGRGDDVEQNNDLITSYFPGADLTYRGRRTQLRGGYGGSFLTYRANSLFNRWDQRADVNFRRFETARFEWSMQGNLRMLPSTDALDFEGIPFSHTGATALVGRAGFLYKPGARHQIGTAVQTQWVRFDRPGELLPYLRGGEAVESSTSYQRRVNARLSIGGNYLWRRADVVGDFDQVDFHGGRAALTYELTPRWTINAGAGWDFMEATPLQPAKRAPGFSVAANHSAGTTHVGIGYQRLFLPSFGYGGGLQSQEVGVFLSAPLFRSRYFYTDQSLRFWDNRPLIETPGQLHLRSLLIMSRIGWAPRPWFRAEGFYGRTQQNTLIPGGAMDRNRLGFQIVTSTPVRMQ